MKVIEFENLLHFHPQGTDEPLRSDRLAIATSLCYRKKTCGTCSRNILLPELDWKR